jgi:hypothetical protein
VHEGRGKETCFRCLLYRCSFLPAPPFLFFLVSSFLPLCPLSLFLTYQSNLALRDLSGVCALQEVDKQKRPNQEKDDPHHVPGHICQRSYLFFSKVTKGEEQRDNRKLRMNGERTSCNMSRYVRIRVVRAGVWSEWRMGRYTN